MGAPSAFVALLVVTACHTPADQRSATSARFIPDHPDAVATPVWFDRAELDAQGRRDAEADIRNGRLRLKSFGTLAPWHKEYDATLKRRYGIDVVRVAGCVVDEHEIEWRAYNQVMVARIERGFGRGILDKVGRRVEAVYYRRHPTGR